MLNWLRIQGPYAAKAFLRPIYYWARERMGMPIPENPRFPMRWGRPPRDLTEVLKGRRPIWIDALSGGEATQIVSFCRRLQSTFPRFPLLLSSNNEYARRFCSERISALTAVIETPWDIGFVVRRSLRRLRPCALIFVENVYSPILAKEASHAGIPTILVSGLVRSEFRPHEIYRRAFGLGFSRYISLFIVKSSLDAECLARLGVPPDRIKVAGNLKFDASHLEASEPALDRLRSDLNLKEDDRILVAGSLHEKEDELVIDAFKALIQKEPKARLILVPRYGKLISSIERKLAGVGLEFGKRAPNSLEIRPGVPVILIDTFGELFSLYALGQAAILGGSFFRRHGVGFSQNIVEPLMRRIPVVFGPYASQFREITSLLEESWRGSLCTDSSSLAQSLLVLLNDQEARGRVLFSMDQILASNRDALEKHVEAVAGFLSVTLAKDGSVD